jgi:putative ABC transport system substrate-binding protein
MTVSGEQKAVSSKTPRKKGMRRRVIVFIWLLLTVLLFTGLLEAQQPAKIPRIGFVSPDGNANDPGPQVEAFRRALRELGYIEGKNMLLELRYIERRSERSLNLVAELVQLKIDVLVLRAQPSIRAAKQATKTIPIVILTTQDPVAAGFIDSLARPGGNITGVTTLQRDLSGKRLELLNETARGLLRVAALVNEIQKESHFKLYEAPARALKIQLQPIILRGPNPDFETAFQVVAKERANVLITIAGGLLNPNAKRIADLAIKNRLPSMHERGDYVEAGGLMSYSAKEAEIYRRAAIYVDKILKGKKPAELPVEQPTDFDLMINLKTSKQIGLTVPPNVLARADGVIR